MELEEKTPRPKLWDGARAFIRSGASLADTVYYIQTTHYIDKDIAENVAAICWCETHNLTAM